MSVRCILEGQDMAYRDAVLGGYTDNREQFKSDIVTAQPDNPNLFDNWYLPNATSQNGILGENDTESNGNFHYPLDRYWLYSKGIWSITPEGLVINHKGNYSYWSLGQVIKRFGNKSNFPLSFPVTCSILVDNDLYSITFVPNAEESIVRFPFEDKLNIVYRWYGPATDDDYPSIEFCFYDKMPFPCTIKAIKLEIGTKQTLARKDNNGNWIINNPPNIPNAERLQWNEGVFSKEMHRTTFRGKNLGSEFTAAQKAAVANGSFKDLFLGDYWTINNIVWRIVDMDYWLGTGDTALLKHHLVIMPDIYIASESMNNTNTTDGGYFGCKARANLLSLEGTARGKIQTAFGNNNLITHREYLCNAVTDGHPSGGIWCNSVVELPNEIMMYGNSFHAATANNGIVIPDSKTLGRTQLALFQIAPRYIRNSNPSIWLRDIVSATDFAKVQASGEPNHYVATEQRAIRPIFAIG